MRKREDGYYWVKETSDRDWCIAYYSYYDSYDDHTWTFMGSDESSDEEYLFLIDECKIERDVESEPKISATGYIDG